MFREIPTLRCAAHHEVATLPSLLTSLYINLSNRRNHILQPTQPLHCDYPPSWCVLIYMCLYPMMTERTRPWMPVSSNQPDQPILLLSRSHALALLSLQIRPNPSSISQLDHSLSQPLQSLHLFHFQPSSPHYTLYINIV